MHDLALFTSTALMLVAALVICAGAGVVLMRAERLEMSWRTATGWALLAAAAVLAIAAVRYATSGAEPPLDVALFATLVCVPVLRVLCQRRQRDACFGSDEPPESVGGPRMALGSMAHGAAMGCMPAHMGAAIGSPPQDERFGRSRVYREWTR